MRVDLDDLRHRLAVELVGQLAYAEQFEDLTGLPTAERVTLVRAWLDEWVGAGVGHWGAVALVDEVAAYCDGERPLVELARVLGTETLVRAGEAEWPVGSRWIRAEARACVEEAAQSVAEGVLAWQGLGLREERDGALQRGVACVCPTCLRRAGLPPDQFRTSLEGEGT